MAELGPNPWSAWLQVCVLEVLFPLEGKSDAGFAYSLESKYLMGGQSCARRCLRPTEKDPITYCPQCYWDFILEEKRELARLSFMQILACASLLKDVLTHSLTLTPLPGHTVNSRRRRTRGRPRMCTAFAQAGCSPVLPDSSCLPRHLVRRPHLGFLVSHRENGDSWRALPVPHRLACPHTLLTS